MTSIRARTAQNEADREMHEHLAAAVRALDKAEACCGRFARLDGTTNRVSPGKARTYLKTVRQAKGLLHGIGSLVSKIDFDDPDLLPEDTRAEMTRTKRQEAQAAAKTEAAGRGS